MKKRLAVLLCVILPFSGAFSAEDFHYQHIGGFDVAINSDGFIWKEINSQDWVGFYNKTGEFHLINVNVVGTDKLWEMISFERGKYEELGNGLIYGSSVVLMQFNCKKKMSRPLQTYAYNEYWGQGRIVHSFDAPGRWVYSIPGTTGERMLQYSCAILKRNKK